MRQYLYLLSLASVLQHTSIKVLANEANLDIPAVGPLNTRDIGVVDLLEANVAQNTQPMASYQLFSPESFNEFETPKSCQAALTAPIRCHNSTQEFEALKYRGVLPLGVDRDTVCQPSCGTSLKNWFASVKNSCADYKIDNGPANLRGGIIWAGWNETCLVDPEKKKNCNEVIASFPDVESLDKQDKKYTCSYCNVERLEMMRRTPYSIYDEFYKSQLTQVHQLCGIKGPTDIPPPIVSSTETTRFCATDKSYQTKAQDTCDSIALSNKVSAASLFTANQGLLISCCSIPAGLKLCVPIPCDKTYKVADGDTCESIEAQHGLKVGILSRFNPWIATGCGNFKAGIKNYGKVICISPPGGLHTATAKASAPTPKHRQN